MRGGDRTSKTSEEGITPSIASENNTAFPSTDSPAMAGLEEVRTALTTFDCFGGDAGLDSAVGNCETALQLPSVLFDSDQALEWKILQATALYLRFERDGNDDDTERATQIFRDVISSSDLSLSLHLHALYGLGRVFEARYDQYDTDLEKSCEYYRQAISLASTTTDFPNPLSDEIAAHLGRQLAYLRTSEDSSEAVTLISGVVERRQLADGLGPTALGYLAAAYFSRWWHGPRDSKDDLIGVEECVRESLRLAPRHRHRGRFLTVLANACVHGYETPDRVREGLACLQQALALLPSIPPRGRTDRAILATMSVGSFKLFEAEGALEHLDVALKYDRLLLPDLGLLAPKKVINLCVNLGARFEETGRLIDIDDAIELGNRLDFSSVPLEHELGLLRLNLGRAHLSRFEIVGDISDFQSAESYLRLGMENMTPVLHPHLLSNLARLYSSRFEGSPNTSYLDQSIEIGRNVIAHFERMANIVWTACAISLHGARLLKRFDVQNNVEDLDDSIVNHRKALQLVSISYFERHRMLFRYSRALRLRFERDYDPQDSVQCLELLNDALGRARACKLPEQSIYLAEVAALLSAQFLHQPLKSHLDEALAFYTKSVHCVEGLISHRFRTAIAGARFAFEHSQVLQSTELFAAAVSFLPRIAWLGLNVSKRHAKLVHTASYLACDAAASAIKSGQLERAVELLEEGRSILWKSILELRTDLGDLKEVAPDLAFELVEIGQALEHDDMSTTQSSEKHAEQRSARRRRTAERWEELVNKVRTIEGFHSFLKPSSFSLLREAAASGPVVLLNVSGLGSAALIVFFSEPVLSVPLPGLDLSTIHRLAYLLAKALHISRDEAGRQVLDRVLLDISRQLWMGGLRSVVRALSRSQSNSEERPMHVWWIPTGLLSLLPIHCAGPYEIGHKGIPDLFISSYSTTMSALIAARRRRSNELDQPAVPIRMLAIGLPQTPGLPPLPSSRAEMEVLATNLTSCSFLYGPDATIAGVINALPNYQWIHACCHGHWNGTDPLNSAFNLMDGPLTLSRIVHTRLQAADFAFLSACHTARHTAWLPDESIHLAAGLQIAGYKGVLATAWSMADRDGPHLAERFYHYLGVNNRPLDSRNAAEALYLAINDLRGTGVPLYRWGAFVHFGI